MDLLNDLQLFLFRRRLYQDIEICYVSNVDFRCSNILTINIPMKFETSFIRKDNVIYEIISECLNKFTKLYFPVKIFIN